MKTRPIAVLCLAFACAAGAAPVKIARRAEVFLNCSPRPPEITVVFDDVESDNAPGLWEKDRFVVTLNPPRDASALTASVRFGGVRTGRVKAYVEQRGRENVAQFTFRCMQQTSWSSLHVAPKPEQTVSYVRVMPANSALQTIASNQRGALMSGTIDAILPLTESIFLNIGEALPGTTPLKSHIAIIGGKYGPDDLAGNERQYDRQKIIDRHAEATGQPNAGNAKDLFETPLPKNFTAITFRVRK